MATYSVFNHKNSLVKINFASAQDLENFIAYFGTLEWVVIRPTLGAMTLTPDVLDHLNRLGYGKGCVNKVAAIKFLRAMTGMGLKETKDFCDTHLWS